MGKLKKNNGDVELERLIKEITLDANGEDECFVAFQTVLEDELGMRIEANALGEGVAVEGWKYDGNERLGVTAKVKRRDGRVFEVSAWELEVPAGTPGEGVLAAYRLWLGLEPIGNRKQGRRASAAGSVEVERKPRG